LHGHIKYSSYYFGCFFIYYPFVFIFFTERGFFETEILSTIIIVGKGCAFKWKNTNDKKTIKYLIVIVSYVLFP